MTRTIGWYLHDDEARAAGRRVIAEAARAAETAGVPWHYDLSPCRDHERLARLYVCRAIGERDPWPTNERMERDLLALGDFSCQPLHDFQRGQHQPATE